MALKASFTAIRYYTAADPYHYTIDNRPLTDLKAGLDFLADTMDAGFTTALLTTTAITTASTTALTISTLGGAQLKVSNTATAVNFWQFTGSSTGNAIGASAQGTDALVPVNIQAKGGGNINLFTNALQVAVTDTVGATRWVTLTGSNAANPAIGTSAGNLSLTSAQVLFADGAVGAPSMAFAAEANTGWYRVTSGFPVMTVLGAQALGISSTGDMTLPSTGTMAFTATNVSGARDVILIRDAAATLAQRNGVNAQAYRIYNTFTDASNYERVELAWIANVATFRTISAGTGTARVWNIASSAGGTLGVGTNTQNWNVHSNGMLLAGTDNTFDIGNTATNRPRSGYFAGRLLDGQITVAYSASMTIDASLGNDYIITATNGTAFTINAPTNPLTGQFISILIRNTFGTLGVATWNAIFKMTAWTQPLNGFSRCIYFAYDGTSWVERGRTTADVPN